MTASTAIELQAGWTETAYERVTVGPDDRDGLAATLASGEATLSVVPVRYRVSRGREQVRALDGDLSVVREEPTASLPDAGPLFAFAVRARFAPFGSAREAVPCVAADADDALAVAAWLAGASEDDAALGRNLRLHAGTTPPSRTTPALADDDVLGALFAETPRRCLLTGVETGSHAVRLPYRYAALLAGMKRTGRGVVRFPSTVAGLAGVVSHAAWEERGLADVDFAAPVAREGAGRYRLAEDVAALAADVEASALALRRLGEGR